MRIGGQGVLPRLPCTFLEPWQGHHPARWPWLGRAGQKTPDSRRSEADTAKRRGASGRKSRDIRSVEVTVVKTTFLGEEAAKAFRYLFGRLKFVALIVTDDWDAAVAAHATGFFFFLISIILKNAMEKLRFVSKTILELCHFLFPVSHSLYLSCNTLTGRYEKRCKCHKCRFRHDATYL